MGLTDTKPKEGAIPAKAAVPTIKRPTKKKPKDKPKRPLSAYSKYETNKIPSCATFGVWWSLLNLRVSVLAPFYAHYELTHRCINH